jgi:hypothetical protein
MPDTKISMKKSRFPMYHILTFSMVLFLIGCATSPPQRTETPESQQAKGIVQGAPSPEVPPPEASPQQAPLSSGAQVYAPLTTDEALFFQQYIDRLSYLVYYDESSGLDPQLAKAAVSQANRYLIEKQGLSPIDFEQIQRNKEDQMSAYRAETGGSIDIVTYIAQKLNADIYLEIDAKTTFGGSPGGWTGSAQGSMKIFDASTAVLLGSISFLSPQTFSPVSPEAAMMNAITASVWQSMPKVTEQAKALVGSATARRGVRYELVLQNTPDPKAISQFEKRLAQRVREVERLSYAPGESRFVLYAFLPASKIQDAIYDAAAASGFPDCYLLYMRGRSYTFNTGL